MTKKQNHRDILILFWGFTFIGARFGVNRCDFLLLFGKQITDTLFVVHYITCCRQRLFGNIQRDMPVALCNNWSFICVSF